MSKNIIWKPIPGYEGHYEASNTGLIRSVDRVVVLKTKLYEDRPCSFKGRILKPYMQKYKRSNIKPRQCVALSVDGKLKTWAVHRLIALSFLPNENNYETVNHIDGDCNNNHVDNLEWSSKEENARHAFKNGLVKTQKLIAQIDPVTNKIIKVYPGESEACRQIGISQGKIGFALRNGKMKRGYWWKYVNENDEGVTTIEPWTGPSKK